MIKRIMQFVRGVHSELTSETLEEARFVRKYIKDEILLELYYGMNRIDQVHSLRVAYTAKKLAEESYVDLNMDMNFLMRCCLLHDIGRKKGDMGLFDKVWAVLAYKFIPKYALRLSKKCSIDMHPIKKHFAHVFFIYKNHGTIGAAMLSTLQMERESSIIARHHRLERRDDPIELRILRKADSMN